MTIPWTSEDWCEILFRNTSVIITDVFRNEIPHQSSDVQGIVIRDSVLHEL